MVKWPAILKYHGDDDLSYVHSQAAWNRFTGSATLDFDASDTLIDSTGLVYHLHNKNQGMVEPVATDHRLTLEQLIKLVQQHAAVNGECCIEKILFKNIGQGISLVATIGEQEQV